MDFKLRFESLFQNTICSTYDPGLTGLFYSFLKDFIFYSSEKFPSCSNLGLLQHHFPFISHLSINPVDSGMILSAFDTFQQYSNPELLDSIRYFLFTLIVGLDLIPKEYLYPMWESLHDFPCLRSEIPSLLKFAPLSHGCHFPETHYHQIFMLALIVVSSASQRWLLVPKDTLSNIQLYVSASREHFRHLPPQLILGIAELYARLESHEECGVIEKVSLFQSLAQQQFRELPPSPFLLRWFWNQGDLFAWNTETLLFFLQSKEIDDVMNIFIVGIFLTKLIFRRR
jgi:hypothetical protein